MFEPSNTLLGKSGHYTWHPDASCGHEDGIACEIRSSCSAVWVGRRQLGTVHELTGQWSTRHIAVVAE
ncbi:MAG: hypothetical protein GKR94_00150 [Gammaproteobacteria bacterium]|nr:hypothetical protein [Gammaproteobacteria bacterium]